MTHNTASTLSIASSGGSLVFSANQGSASVSTQFFLLGAPPVTTSVNGTGVLIETDNSSSFQIAANVGTAAAIGSELNILAPATISPFFFTTATGNEIFIETTILRTSVGGTGLSSLTANSLIYGQGTNPVGLIPPGANGQALIANTGNISLFNAFTSSNNSLTFTFGPNSLNMDVANFLSTMLPLQPSSGGTGRSLLTIFGVLIGEGSLAIHGSNPGTNGQLLIASSTGDPKFATISSTGGTLTFKAGVNSLNIEINWFGSSFFNPLPVGNGGTGTTVFTAHGVLIGEGSLQVQATNAGTNGQLLIASSTGNPAFSTVTSNRGTLTFTFGYNSLNVDVDLSTLTFTNLLQVPNGGTGDVLLTIHGVLIGEGSNPLFVTPAGTDGQMLIGSSTGEPLFSSLTSVQRTLTFHGGNNSLDMEVNFSQISFSTVLPVGWGGGGNTILTSFGVLVGEGSLPIHAINPGLNGQVLLASSVADPQFAFITSADFSLTFTFGYNSLNMDVNLAGFFSKTPLAPMNGGTGQTVFTSHTVLIGKADQPFDTTNVGTNGEILIAATGTDPAFATLTSLGGSFTFIFGYNSLDIEAVTTSISLIQANLGAATPNGNEISILGMNGVFTTGSGSTIVVGIDLANATFFNPLPIGNGGTGQTVLTSYGVLIGEGSNSIHATAPGTNGQALIASSTDDPKFATLSSTGKTLTFTAGANSLNIDVVWSGLSFFAPVGSGGTGTTLFTSYSVLLGTGSLSIHGTNVGTNGQVLIGSSTGDPKFANLTSTGGSITFTLGYNSLNIDVNLSTFSFFNPLSVQNGGTGLTWLTAYGVLIGEGSLPIHVTPPGTNGQTLIGSSSGDPKFAAITSTGNTLTFNAGPNSLNIDVNFSIFTFINPLQVPNGGTGRTILTTFGVLIGSSSLSVIVTPAGTNGQTLIASSTGAPRFATITSTGATLTFTFGMNSLNIDANFSGYSFLNPLTASFGGTGKQSVLPYAVLCGGTSSTSAIQTVGTVGSSGQLLTSNGPNALPSFQSLATLSVINVQTFTSGTAMYTPSPNTLYCQVECIGGGGAGGGVSLSTSGKTGMGSGGGAGGYSSIILSVGSASGQIITVGNGATGTTGAGTAGGASSLGTLISASGGSGGQSIGNARGAVGGAGGIGSFGTVNLSGQPGGRAWGFNESGTEGSEGIAVSGIGGDSFFLGGGEMGVIPILGTTGTAGGGNGTSPGAGGGGAAAILIGSGTLNLNGGNGANGIVMITEYMSS